MSEFAEIGPLNLQRTSAGLHLTFRAVEDPLPDLPSDLDAMLEAQLSPWLAANPPIVQLDLSITPAISSRQLGFMIALQKAVRRRIGRLQVIGASDNIRRLLETTNTAQFFDVRAPGDRSGQASSSPPA